MLLDALNQKDTLPLPSSDYLQEFRKGWYGLQIQNGPIQYAYTPHRLFRFKHCLSNQNRLYEGDLLSILSWSKSKCNVKIKPLAASIRLSLGLPLQLNTTSVDNLTLISGLGTKRAQHILKHRPYRSIRDLLSLKGVGRKTLRKWTPFITLNPPTLIGPLSKTRR